MPLKCCIGCFVSLGRWRITVTTPIKADTTDGKVALPFFVWWVHLQRGSGTFASSPWPARPIFRWHDSTHKQRRCPQTESIVNGFRRVSRTELATSRHSSVNRRYRDFLRLRSAQHGHRRRQSPAPPSSFHTALQRLGSGTAERGWLVATGRCCPAAGQGRSFRRCRRRTYSPCSKMDCPPSWMALITSVGRSVLPPLPPKDAIQGKVGGIEFMDQRREGLQRFLCAATHPPTLTARPLAAVPIPREPKWFSSDSLSCLPSAAIHLTACRG